MSVSSSNSDSNGRAVFDEPSLTERSNSIDNIMAQLNLLKSHSDKVRAAATINSGGGGSGNIKRLSAPYGGSDVLTSPLL